MKFNRKLEYMPSRITYFSHESKNIQCGFPLKKLSLKYLEIPIV